MRWSAILAPLRFSQSDSLSSAILNKSSISALPRTISPQKSPAATPLPSLLQARSSSQIFAIANSGHAHVAELGIASSCQAETAPIRSSTTIIAISEDKDSSVQSGTGQGAASHTVVRPTEEKFRLSTSENVKREAGRRQALRQVNRNSLEGFRGHVNADISSAHVRVSASSSNLATAAKNWAPSQRNDEANHPNDHIRTTEIQPSQTESKVTPRLSLRNLLSSNAMHVSTGQMGDPSVDVVVGVLNKRVGHDTSPAEDDISAGDLSEDITASSTNSRPEYIPANGTSEHPPEDKNQDELKKRSFATLFPVTIFLEWWFSCFLQVNRPFYTTLNHPFNKVYAWLAAYQRVHFDAMGHYIDGQRATTLMTQLLNLQNAVLDGKFRWGDEKFVFLPTPVAQNGEPLSNDTTFPSFQDRVVREILYLVLEPIFESRFSARSHGFRPGREAHTALRAAQRSFQGCNWFISGNLSFLHEEIDATHLVGSVLRVVRDTRIIFLLRSGFLVGKPEQGESIRACMFGDQGSCSKLRNLLFNVFLDQLDWFMEEQISNLVQRQQPPTQCASGLLFKSERVRAERPCKLEYLRYGTEILVACNGTRDEAEAVEKNIQSFFKQKFSMDLGDSLTISHISDGVQFLDHVLSQKIVRPFVSRRRASNGRVFEKRAHRIRLTIKASRECCLMYLKKINTPTSLQHIEQMLLVLDNWYHYAENKEKMMQYCKWTLCYLYAKGVIETKKEGLMDFAEQFKEAMRTLECDKRRPGVSDKANLMQYFYSIPEHENVLREQAWLQNKSSMTEVADRFKTGRKVSLQQHMSQVMWQYLGGPYPSNGDDTWESEVQVHTSSTSQEFMVDTKLEEVAESAG